MGDRASVHITIGGALPREHLEDLAARAADYDLRTEWDGEPFDPVALPVSGPLELYGTELNGGHIPEIEAFCAGHGLPFRRWSGGCPGAYLPEIVLFDGESTVREYAASEGEQVLFTAAWINSFTRLRDLKREVGRAERAVPAFVITGRASNDNG